MADDYIIRLFGKDLTGPAFRSVVQSTESTARATINALGNATRAAQEFSRSSMDGAKRVGGASDELNRTLTTMVGRYAAVGAAAVTAQKAFLGFAETDFDLRRLAATAGRTFTQVEAFLPLFRQWRDESGRTIKEIEVGFNTLRETGRLTWDDTVKAFPAVVQMGLASKADMAEISRFLGSAMLQMGISADKAGTSLNILWDAQKKYNIEVEQLMRWGPQLISLMTQYGYTGIEGYKRMLVYIGSINRATGDTQKSSRYLLELFGSLDFEKIGAKIQMTQLDMTRAIGRAGREGKDVLGMWFGWVDKAVERGLELGELPVHMQIIYSAWKKDQASMRAETQALGQDFRALGRDVESIGKSPYMTWTQMISQLTDLRDEFGRLLQDLGAGGAMSGLKTILGEIRGVISIINVLIEATKKMIDYAVDSIPGLRTFGNLLNLAPRPSEVATSMRDRMFGGKGLQSGLLPQEQAWVDRLKVFGRSLVMTTEELDRYKRELEDTRTGKISGALSGAGAGFQTYGGVGAPKGSYGGGGVAAPGGGPDSSIPSNVLDRAKQIALSGDPNAVAQFMQSQGYPKNGNWCGEFTAAVVRSVGGTPPANPQIASNWRNYGAPVTGAPQPGDIAVRRGDKHGLSVPTGQTGSHVTTVESYDPQSGTFSGIGGNQGKPRSQFLSNQYDFFRGGQGVAAGGTGAVVGGASYYDPTRPGTASGGPRTSSGEMYDPNAYTAAIQSGLRDRYGGVHYGKNYQPRYALVEQGGKQVIVRINDTGPLTPGRVIDLSRGAMQHFDPSLSKGVLSGTKVTPLPPGQDYKTGPVQLPEANATPLPPRQNYPIGSTPAPAAVPSQGFDYNEMRRVMDQPFKISFERDPGEAQFRRTSMRREADKEFRDARWSSYSDIGAA